MKNLKNLLNFKKLDFAAIHVLLSVIAISFAGMVSDASLIVAVSDLYKPILPTISSDLKVCPIPYSVESCKKQSPRANSCELGSADILQNLSLSPLLKANDRPLCSSPNNRGQQTDSPFWQNG